MPDGQSRNRSRKRGSAAVARISAAVAWSLTVLALCAPAPVLHAQVTASEKAAAEALFDAGLSLMREGKYPEACDKLQQSQRIEPGIGTQLYLGECFAKVGRTASAWAVFREAASAAQAQGQTARAEAGARRATELQPDLSYLTVGVAADNRAVDGITVTVGEVALSPQTWGVRIPVDPGPTKVVAAAPGYLTFEVAVTVPDKGGDVSTEVPPLSKDPNAVAPVAAATAPPAASESAARGEAELSLSSSDAVGNGLSTEQIAGIATAGAGVVAIGVGAFFGLDAMSKNDDADGNCDPNEPTQCNAAGVTLGDEAADSATLSTAFWAGGAALVAIGAVLFFVEPFGGDGDTAEQALVLHPVVSADGRQAGLVLQGGF